MFERFRAASPTRQIQLIALGVFLIGGLLVGAWFAFVYTPYQPLFGNLRTADAATIVASLEQKKIPYRLANGGTTILVPADRVDSTRLNVMTDDLPLKGTVGFELFNKSDMGITDFAQKINYQRALQGELERTIMTLDGVDTARVHLSLGEDRIFRDDRVPPKASVTVRMEKGAALSLSAAQGVRRLVAAAVPNLDIANVVILDEEGRVVSAAPQIASVSELNSPMIQEKHAIEQYYEARIRQAFDHAHAPGGIGVGVSVDVAADANSAALDGLANWSPGARQFPLQITLSPATPLDPASQENVRSIVAGAIASSATQDDVIAFGAAAEAASVPLPDVQHTDAAQQMMRPPAALPLAEEEHDWLLETGLVFALLVLVLVGFFLLLRQLRNPRRLSEQQRADFVAKLRAGLQQEGEHAASRS